MNLTKIDDSRAYIIEDGDIIGQVMKHEDAWIVEVLYSRRHFKTWDKEKIEAWVEGVYGLRRMKILHDIRNSEKYKDWQIKE